MVRKKTKPQKGLKLITVQSGVQPTILFYRTKVAPRGLKKNHHHKQHHHHSVQQAKSTVGLAGNVHTVLNNSGSGKSQVPVVSPQVNLQHPLAGHVKTDLQSKSIF